MTDDIEKLSRRRRIVLAGYGILFLVFQGVVFRSLDAPVALWRAVDWAKAAGFVGWSGTLIFVLATGGLLFRGSPAARAAMNDELTIANRKAGYRAGYWAVLASTAICFVLVQFEATTVSEALRVLFAIGVATPAIRFAGLERRQGA